MSHKDQSKVPKEEEKKKTECSLNSETSYVFVTSMKIWKKAYKVLAVEFLQTTILLLLVLIQFSLSDIIVNFSSCCTVNWSIVFLKKINK